VLKDCLNVFKSLYESKGDRLIIDKYIMSEGTYILVDKEGNIEGELEIGKNDVDKTDEMYYEFAERDYLSKLLDMNKPIDSKKVIHSNNYFSFFIKKENINKGKLTDEIIDNYYKVLLNPRIKYEKDKKKLLMYEQLEGKYGKADEEIIEKNKKWIKENIFKIKDKYKQDKNYLKVFFKYPIEDYIKESQKYVIPNIYNNTQYNLTINDKIYGLPNDNMGLNSKKPYLENKSRKNSMPYLIPLDEVMLQRKFFDYLMNLAAEGKSNIYIDNTIQGLNNQEHIEDDFTGYFLRIKKGKEVEIHDFQYIPMYRGKIEGLKIEEVIHIDYSKVKQELDYKSITKISEISAIFNEVYFNKFLTSNYFTEPKDIKLNDVKVKENLIKARVALFNWFYKGEVNGIKSIFPRVTLDLIKNSICNDYLVKAKEQFNLRCALIKYFKGGPSMGDILKPMVSNLRGKINNNDTCVIETDGEYYFSVGQLVSYLISLNKSNKKMHSLINPILNCKTDEKLKVEIRKLFKKYNYAIKKDSKRFNNLTTMILGYTPEGAVQEDLLIAGYLHNNLIYEKSEEDKNE